MRALIKILIVGASWSTVLFAAAPVNFSGKWALEIPRPGGQTQQVMMVLNQVGNEVGGHIIVPPRNTGYGSPINTEIHDGKADGESISFYVWEGRDQMAQVLYKGTMVGEQITFTLSGGPPSYNQRGERNPPRPPQQVTAKRAK